MYICYSGFKVNNSNAIFFFGHLSISSFNKHQHLLSHRLQLNLTCHKVNNKKVKAIGLGKFQRFVGQLKSKQKTVKKRT